MATGRLQHNNPYSRPYHTGCDIGYRLKLSLSWYCHRLLWKSALNRSTPLDSDKFLQFDWSTCANCAAISVIAELMSRMATADLKDQTLDAYSRF